MFQGTLLSLALSTLTNKDILRLLQQILRLLVVRIDNDEFDLLKMQDDTVIAENDIPGRSGPQQASVSSAKRGAGRQGRPRGSYCSPLASICHTCPGPRTLKRPAISKR